MRGWVFDMRVNNLDSVMKVYNTNNNKDDKKVKQNKEDKIELSTEAKDYKFAMDKLKETPEMIQSRIDDLKSRIQSGKYEVDSKKIADKMVGDANLRKKLNSW